MTPLSAYILAGGRSSRFGSDKSRACINDVPLIVRIADAARTCTSRVTAVADVKDKYSDLGLRTIADGRPGAGPLAGLDTALHDAAHSGDEWIFLASCDLIDLKPAWIGRLQVTCNASDQFVAFRGQFWEPLIACYHISMIARIATQVEKGESSLWKLLKMSTGTSLALPTDWPKTIQANTPGELAAAVSEQMRPPKGDRRYA